MSFKILREWLFAGMHRHRRRHGHLVVSYEGEATIVVRFKPERIVAYFTDAEPPIDPCHPHPHDTLDETLCWLGFGRWGVKIQWSVFGVRHLKYEIDGVAE